MRSIVFRFEDPQALSDALDAAAVGSGTGSGIGGLPLPQGQTGSVGEWVLALFEVGTRRRSTASAARIVSGGEGSGLRIALEARDLERLQAFVSARSEAMRAVPPAAESSAPSLSKAPFEVTLSGRFKAASVSRVLVTDSDETTSALVKEALASLTVTVDTHDNIVASLTYLTDNTVSLWVVGADLTDGNGLEVIRRGRRESRYGGPVLMVAKAGGARLAVQAFAAGATDFIAQPFRVSELAARTVTLLSHAGVRTP